MRYPRLLSYGHNNKVVALSETEVGKLFGEDTRSDIGSEAEKMRYANAVNGLVAGFVRLDIHAETGQDMLVMERLYPVDFRAYEVEKRELWLEVFEYELKELHRNGFAHGDLQRPANIPGEPFDNIFLTDTGIRLIDVGISVLRDKVGEPMFNRHVQQDLDEFAKFAHYFLNR